LAIQGCARCRSTMQVRRNGRWSPLIFPTRTKISNRTASLRCFREIESPPFDEAITDYDGAIQQNANDAGSLYSRGVAKIKSGDTKGGNAYIAAAKAIQADTTPATGLSDRLWCDYPQTTPA
jgi:hypothetical protein